MWVASPFCAGAHAIHANRLKQTQTQTAPAVSPKSDAHGTILVVGLKRLPAFWGLWVVPEFYYVSSVHPTKGMLALRRLPVIPDTRFSSNNTALRGQKLLNFRGGVFMLDKNDVIYCKINIFSNLFFCLTNGPNSYLVSIIRLFLRSQLVASKNQTA